MVVSHCKPTQPITVGVLALQGAFIEHINVLRQLPEVKFALAVRTPAELENVDALVIPGGESTSMALIAERMGMMEPLRKFIHSGKPCWGTCAGMILLADEATSTKKGGQSLIGGLRISVNRNQFGSQRDSFEMDLSIPCIGDQKFHAVFIRAPVITEIKDPENVEVLAKLEQAVGQTASEAIVAVRQGPLMATAFHPELTMDSRMHRYFVRMAQEYVAKV
ncbi:uncharacterized protein VTP21DRAFT_8093 [Calcarisporiella thermophila]|uniref:uncharacterized protein n=1 Tax=Calcarisporiella thermophila TaxID=911321 RepID=UPI0037441A3A